MAFTTCALIVTFMTITTAAIFGEPNNNHFQRFPPRFQNPFPFNPFALLNMAQQQMPQLPFMPMMPHIQMPNEEDILKMKPKPGQSYSAVFASDKGGKKKVAFNIDGHVFEETTYNRQFFIIRILKL
ncbi:hypothetical protein O3G_MSEX004946 [Manduca sexta]|uniref:Uncharacterized protein n=1 Tax=Manduca sexta TaxID=7130 RepID=A0A922CHV0_MANSE|nr:hypothetical protein O3G_MSEX004946 [Manduca sexta]KAG6447425.1 hypothetical protein O3G_MSEX004946 [Manduca sexta]